MTHVLLVGKMGQIGWELFQSLRHITQVTATERSELDITNQRDVLHMLETVKPDIVINATGYNNVDAAEVEKEQAEAVNMTANAILSNAARQQNAFYITYSTDYVFDGKKNSPYVESDRTKPLNVYGQTKLDGELATVNSGADYLILRTSSVFSMRRPCFVTNFLEKTRHSARIPVRSDLTSSPTSARYLAEMTTQIISAGGPKPNEWLSERKGLYHLTGTGVASRYEWARAICEILNLKVDIVPAMGTDFTAGADRPLYSALDSTRIFSTFNLRPVSWANMLAAILKKTA